MSNTLFKFYIYIYEQSGKVLFDALFWWVVTSCLGMREEKRCHVNSCQNLNCVKHLITYQIQNYIKLNWCVHTCSNCLRFDLCGLIKLHSMKHFIHTTLRMAQNKNIKTSITEKSIDIIHMVNQLSNTGIVFNLRLASLHFYNSGRVIEKCLS